LWCRLRRRLCPAVASKREHGKHWGGDWGYNNDAAASDCVVSSHKWKVWERVGWILHWKYLGYQTMVLQVKNRQCNSRNDQQK
jgi:hypothetical protein